VDFVSKRRVTARRAAHGHGHGGDGHSIGDCFGKDFRDSLGDCFGVELQWVNDQSSVHAHTAAKLLDCAAGAASAQRQVRTLSFGDGLVDFLAEFSFSAIS
jgi:hypothetical protein